MTFFYMRWAGVVIAGILLAFLTYQNYAQHLASITPEEILANPPTGDSRVLGLVKGGSLRGNLETGNLRFVLSGDQDSLPVHYQGPPPENLRELKHLIVIGRWNAHDQVFQAKNLGLVTHYGFVLSAYLVGLVPLALFLFAMGRKVSLLYNEIKDSKLYQPEWDKHVDPR